MEYGAVAVWWVACVVLGAAGVPLSATLLSPLRDRGAALALPVALTVLFVPVYWIGQLHYGPGVVAIGAVVVAGLSATATRRSPAVDVSRFAEWAVVFTLAFLLMVAVRAVDPGVIPGGGEKFLDFGLLTSLDRATALPPEDVWFAGEPVAYYYGGHLLVSTLATLSATPTRLAFNLAIAGFYGTLVGAAYGVAGSIGAARGRSYRWAGALGAFFVGLASNVVPALQAVLWVLPEGLAARVASAVAARTALPTEQLFRPGAFSYWTASRVIPGTINEFPLFAFVNGDLHAHHMSTPFLLLVVGIGFAYTRTPAGAVRRRRLLVFGAVPPVAGLLAVVNTWSLPSAVGVTGLSVLFADAPVRDLLPGRIARKLQGLDGATAELVRVGVAGLVAAAVAVLAVLWVLPFVLGPATGAGGRSIGLLPERSGLLGFLLVHGWFLAVYAVYLLGRSVPAAGRSDVPRGWLVVGLLVALATGAAVGAVAIAIVLPMLLAAWYLLRRDGGVGYETLLFVAGAGLVVLVELVFLREEAGPGRFNTVFKTYAQVWVLWGTGAGATLAALVPFPASIPLGRDRLTAGLVGLLLVSTSVYAGATFADHFVDSPEPTLDGTAWARTYHPAEWEAITYLDERSGQPTIVTAPGCWCNPDEVATPYRWANAPSTYTGVPTVVGWQHEVGYRGWDAYLRRYEDVKTIYTGTAEERTRLLAAYDVSYVYVGPNERAIYDGVDLSGAPELTVVFENEEVTIYEVDRSKL